MNLQLFLSDRTKGRLRHFPPDIKRKIRVGLDEIRAHPAAGKDLSKKLEGWKSYRTGAMRIIYRREPRGIEVLAVGHRRTIYEEAARVIGKAR